MLAPSEGRVGSLAWTRETKGKLVPRDYPPLVGQLVLVLGKGVPERILGPFGLLRGFREVSERHLRPPDEDSASLRAQDEAEKFCKRLAPSFLIGHSRRTYTWASILAARDRIAVDHTVLYVACLLHDAGLSEAHRGPAPSACFTLVGAEQARRICLSAGWPEERSRKTEEAITLHMNPHVRRREGAEAELLARGSQLDVLGIGFWGLTRGARAWVLDRFPREAAKEGFAELFRREHHHPGSRAHLYSRLGIRWLIRAAPFDD